MSSIEITTMPHQTDFLNSDAEITMLVCGRGAGKTFSLIVKVAALVGEGKSMIIGAPNFDQLNKAILRPLVKQFREWGVQFKYNKNEKIIEIGKSTIYGVSGEAYESFRGPTDIDALIIDEAALVAEEAMQVWAACLRGENVKDPEFYFATTPRGTNNWIYRYSLLEESKVIHATTKDNTKVADSYYKTMARMYGDTQFAEQELEGTFCDFSGGLFDYKSIVDLDENTDINISSLCIAFDLAYTEKKNSDYSAAALCGETVNGEFVVIDAIRWKKKIDDTKDIVKGFIAKHDHFGVNIPAYVEANGPQIAIYDMLVKDGVYLNKAPFSNIKKAARMFALSAAMTQGKVMIISSIEDKEAIVDEFREFSIDDSHQSNDDVIDAINYCFLHFNKGSFNAFKSTII